MKDEPDIVKELREAEKFGLLKSEIQSTFEELEIPEESIEKISDQINHKIGDREKRTNEHKLGNVEEKYQTIFENYAIAITLADNKERIVSWNKYAEKLINMTQNELYLKSVSSLYPPDEWQKIRKENVRQKGIKYCMETKMIRKNQGLIEIELSLCILRGKEGKTVGSVGIIKDITKLKEKERELKTSEERYRTIFENFAVAITVTDENERIISWNKCTEALLGMGKEDFYLKPVESLYPPEEWQKIRSQNIRQKGLQHHLETKMFKKNNKIIDVELSVSVLKNYQGKIVGSVGVIKDITERKQIEKSLEASEEKFKQLYEKAPIPYHTISSRGEITSVNEKWCQTLGYEKKEVISRSIFDFIDKNEREIAKSSFKKKIQCKKSYTGGHERTYIRKDGMKKIFLIHDFLFFDNAEDIISIHTTMEDITERKKIKIELEEAHKKLQTMNQELEKKVRQRTTEIEKLLNQKDKFIQQLGHDLKNPLSPLLGLFPLLEKTEKNPKTKELIEVLSRNIDRIKNIIFKTLELAELNIPNVVFNIKDINLWEEVENSIKDQQIMYKEKGITFNNKIDKNIFVKADSTRLSEVFNNLINNSVKYSPLGANITIDAHSDEVFVTVSVIDYGIGMTTYQIDHIFDEFYKADESRHDLGSSGLGLSICRSIIEKHGGRIWAESPGIGKGSTFYFTVPSSSKIDKDFISE